MQRFMLPAALALAALVCVPVCAQDDSTKGASDASFVVNINLDAVRKSSVGGPLLEAARKAALEELEQHEGGYEEVKKALGLDPFEDIHGLTVVGNDFEEPEKNLQLVLSLGKSAGNLEGLIVTLPGYSSSDYGNYRIHSAQAEGGVQAFGTPVGFAAIHTD